jgi:hypothetical protein
LVGCCNKTTAFPRTAHHLVAIVPLAIVINIVVAILGVAISVTADQAKKGTFSFQINTPRRIYLLQAESQDQADYWINGVNDILKSMGSQSDGTSYCLLNLLLVLLSLASNPQSVID